MALGLRETLRNCHTLCTLHHALHRIKSDFVHGRWSTATRPQTRPMFPFYFLSMKPTLPPSLRRKIVWDGARRSLFRWIYGRPSTQQFARTHQQFARTFQQFARTLQQFERTHQQLANNRGDPAKISEMPATLALLYS